MTEPVASYVIPRAGVGHSDYIVYVDESGDHSLTSINPRYPLFVLSFCVFRKAVYNEQVAPALRRLKFAAFGHDMVVLHESDMRRRRGAFAHLMQVPREQFLDDVTGTWARHGARAAHVQIAGFPGRHEPAGGEIDYPAFFDRLDADGYRGWVSAEYSPGTTTQAGLGWLQPRS